MNTICKDAALTRKSLIKIDARPRFRLKYMILGGGRQRFLQAATATLFAARWTAKN
jgi:hypothetical protein